MTNEEIELEKKRRIAKGLETKRRNKEERIREEAEKEERDKVNKEKMMSEKPPRPTKADFAAVEKVRKYMEWKLDWKMKGYNESGNPSGFWDEDDCQDLERYL
jgi:hypothetical protein